MSIAAIDPAAARAKAAEPRCARLLDLPADSLSENCGGDCLACMILVEDGAPAPDLPRADLHTWLDAREQRMSALWGPA